MKWLHRWFAGWARRPEPSPDSELHEKRARYRELRANTAVCLYRLHQLRGQVAHHEQIAEQARSAARRALLDEDAHRSRSMVARARTALDRAHEKSQESEALRVRADAALESLRRLGEAIAALEERRSRSALDEAERALSLLEAEREIEQALADPAV